MKKMGGQNNNGWASEEKPGDASGSVQPKPNGRGVTRTTVIGVGPAMGKRVGKTQVAPLQESVVPPDVSPLTESRTFPIGESTPDLSVVTALINQENEKIESGEGEDGGAQGGGDAENSLPRATSGTETSEKHNLPSDEGRWVDGSVSRAGSLGVWAV